MRAEPMGGYYNNFVKLNTLYGNIKIDKNLFESYKRKDYNDLILLKNNMSLEILPQYTTRGKFFEYIAAITQNYDWNKIITKNDAEITITQRIGKIRFETKNAKIIIHSKNSKSDNISIINPLKSNISLDKDENDNISVFSQKADTYIGNYYE